MRRALRRVTKNGGSRNCQDSARAFVRCVEYSQLRRITKYTGKYQEGFLGTRILITKSVSVRWRGAEMQYDFKRQVILISDDHPVKRIIWRGREARIPQ